MKKNANKLLLFFLIIVATIFITNILYARTADLYIENAHISGNYFIWELHLKPTDDWGSGNRKALGDCSWYFDYNNDALAFGSAELLYEAPEINPSEGYTNTAGTVGIKVFVDTNLDADNYDGVNLTQEVKYHLYTVRMTITDPSAESNLYWDQVNSAWWNALDQLITPTYYGNGDITLPVELSTFTAQFLNGVPTLYWKTMSETDNLGWFIYRNTEEDFTTAERITDYLIEGYGTTSESHHYIYEDVELNGIPGEAYWYWIQSIDFGGAFHRFGPRIVRIQGEPEHHETPTIPKQYGLHQNKPNPLSIGKETTKISFILPKTAIAEIKIYNIRGELVKDLYKGVAYGDDEVKDIIWDGKDENGVEQRTGIYLYQLKVNGKTYETKRLILLR